MNANDNFEKKDLPIESKDLNEANVTEVSETDENQNLDNEVTNPVEQNKIEPDSNLKAKDDSEEKPSEKAEQKSDEISTAEPETAPEEKEETDTKTVAEDATVDTPDTSEPADLQKDESSVDVTTPSEIDSEVKSETATAKAEEKESHEASTKSEVLKEEETKLEEAQPDKEESSVESTATPETDSEARSEATKEDVTTKVAETESQETSAKDEDPNEEDKKQEEAESDKKKSEKKDAKKARSIAKPKIAVPLTFGEIVDNLRKLSERDKFTRKDVDRAQYLFLNECRKEFEEQKKEFIKEGGKEEDFVGKESELHTEGKKLLETVVEKRKKIAANEEKQKEKNLERKLAMIERVKELTESQDDFNKVYQEFKSLQQEWNNIRLVPHGKEHELWKSFQRQVEKFYDIVRIHNEFRDYDFKKNLESKTGLCEAAEKLLNEEDTVSAFHQLQKLHKDWRDIGPVARKDREVIWQRFKEVSAEINKKYQAHIETLKEKENENYEKKVAICEELEAIDYSVLKNAREWDAKMREVFNLQAAWREIGYAPRKVNAKIFKRYRAACDLFFTNKNAYYQTIRGELDENLKKKIALCERAEEMKESTDWRKTTPEMIDIQREWKEIGMVPRRHSSSIWKRFIAACDYFFEQKKKHTDKLYEEEVQNLKLKNEVTEKIKNIDVSIPNDEALEALKSLMAEWQSIGYVPFKELNKVNREFNEATDGQFSRLNINKSERKLETFKSNISEMTKPDQSRGQVLYEREKLMRQFERMKSDLQTYENNVGFLTSSSKKGNTLVDDMNSKIDKIKGELQLIVKKIEAIDDKI